MGGPTPRPISIYTTQTFKNMLPYIDEEHPDYIVRTFDSNLEEEEFYWHRDRKNRLITAVSGEGWRIQYDNQLPIPLEENKVYPIKKDTWHRVIKGKNDLILQIKEF